LNFSLRGAQVRFARHTPSKTWRAHCAWFSPRCCGESWPSDGHRPWYGTYAGIAFWSTWFSNGNQVELQDSG